MAIILMSNLKEEMSNLDIKEKWGLFINYYRKLRHLSLSKKKPIPT